MERVCSSSSQQGDFEDSRDQSGVHVADNEYSLALRKSEDRWKNSHVKSSAGSLPITTSVTHDVPRNDEASKSRRDLRDLVVMRSLRYLHDWPRRQSLSNRGPLHAVLRKLMHAMSKVRLLAGSNRVPSPQLYFRRQSAKCNEWLQLHTFVTSIRLDDGIGC